MQTSLEVLWRHHVTSSSDCGSGLAASRPHPRLRGPMTAGYQNGKRGPAALGSIQALSGRPPVDEVFGRYRLIEVIGQGGMGTVYRADDTMMRRGVAIKVLPWELASEPGYRERFRREAYTAARLTEPHIIPIYEAGEVDGRLYLVMPVIEGIDLQSVLKRDGPMTPRLAVKVIEQI